MGVMDQRYVVSTWADVDVRSDMKDNHHVSGPLRSFRLLQEGGKKSQLLAAGNSTYELMYTLVALKLT